MSMVVHPNNPNVVFAAGGYLIKSINGGANWSVFTTSLSGANGMSLVGDLSGLLVGGSRDIYYSVDAGATNSTNLIFNSRNLGLRIQRATSAGMLNISDNGETFSSGYRISSTLHTIGSINYNFGYSDGTIFIDQDNPNVIISNSTLYNSNLSSVINLTNSSSSPAYDYDSQNNIFYAFNTTNSSANTTTFYKATGVGTSNTKTTFTVNILMYPSFIRVGKIPNTIFVGGGASVRLPKLIGMARMSDLMFTGRVISAEEGILMGFSQYLTSEGNGLEKGIELAKKIASNAESTNYALMHVLPRIVDSGQTEGLMMESLIATISSSSPEAKKRLTDFLEVRAKKVGE